LNPQQRIVMSQWVYRGLLTGIKTTRYPDEADEQPGVSPGLPLPRTLADDDAGAIVSRCPTGALTRRENVIAVDPRRCVHCMRCARGEDALAWQPGHAWTLATPSARRLGLAFARSLHVRVVDTGDCGACLHEVKQLNNPYYNMHRLGFFITPTPRQADILLVVGPGTEQTREALLKAYDAMPGPRLVIAVGVCALTGGVFGPSFMCSAGVGTLLPVDIEVPGNPPPPLAILHALLVAAGRAERGNPP
jgi:Ni,Fe-hydrogenase III small subunit/NAD-dependent dihydropyrimidine dehydrogenase PreA subunit